MRPEQARILSERNIMPTRGARFFRDGDTVMFEFVIDTSNTIGPMPATRQHQAEHVGAWQKFVLAEGVSPLDRDAVGGVGGSLPVEVPAATQLADAVGASFRAITDAPLEPASAPKRRGRPPKVRPE